MCDRCPKERGHYGTKVCSCGCGSSVVNGKCTRCGHYLDFYTTERKRPWVG